jgi:cystathionine beta-synthase
MIMAAGYVAKVYNDQWMIERGFLDVKTFKDIISSRIGNKNWYQ